MHSGEFKKTITVTSNAKNSPTIRLTLSGTWRQIFSMEPSVIRLVVPKDKDTGVISSITTEKKDLKILGVTFKENGKGAEWLAMIPVRYTLTPDTTGSKTAKKDDPARFTLRLMYTPVEKADKYGDFIIKTNIAEKPEITITGVLEAKKV